MPRALGAQRNTIVRLVLRQGVELAVAGIVAGIIDALELTRLMASLQFGVGATDSATFSVVIALLATYLPARRATEVDPLAMICSKFIGASIWVAPERIPG
jgi:ABC-type lipoprotein release transport system permease subunit